MTNTPLQTSDSKRGFYCPFSVLDLLRRNRLREQISLKQETV